MTRAKVGSKSRKERAVARPKDDNYPTKPPAGRALLSAEAFGGDIWEPCAGEGILADTLQADLRRQRPETAQGVVATTLRPTHERLRAPGEAPSWLCEVRGGRDFFDEKRLLAPNIVTNPPFKIAEKIARHALSLQPAKLALLLNIKFLSGKGRKKGFFAEFPPARVWVFSNRITMYPGDYEGEQNQTTEVVAWFVWEWPYRVVPPAVGWLDSDEFDEATLPALPLLRVIEGGAPCR